MKKENDQQKNIIIKYSNSLKSINDETVKQFLAFDERFQTDVIGMILEHFGDSKILELIKKIADIKSLQSLSDTKEEILLLSSSPRRHFIIKELFGLSFSSQNSETEEYKPSFFAHPETVTKTIALMKLLSIFTGSGINGKYVIASDTLCHLENGTILGKPQGKTIHQCLKDAEFVLNNILPGSIQMVTSSIIVFDVENRKVFIGSASTEIKFKPKKEIDMNILKYYLDLAKKNIHGRGPVGKAGGYGIQEPEILYLAEYINGDPFVVIALPIFETLRLLECCGIPIDKSKIDTNLLIDAVWGKDRCIGMDIYRPLKEMFNSDFTELAKEKIINFL